MAAKATSVIDMLLGGRGPMNPGDAIYRKSPNSPATNVYCIVLILASFGAISWLFKVQSGYDRDLAITVGVITAVVFVGYFITLLSRPERRTLLAPDILIFGFLVVFHLPGVFFEAVGLVQQERRFWYHYTYVNYAMVLDLTGFLGFLIGYNLFARPPSVYLKQAKYAVDYSPAWIRLGQAVFVLGFLLHIYFGLTQISFKQMLTERYTMQRYHSAEFDERFWFGGIFLCRTGIFIVATASAALYGKMMKGWLNWTVFVGYIGFIFITGHRAVVALTFIAPLLAYCYLIRPIKGRNVIIIALLGLFMMSVGIAVRQQEDKNIANVERAISEDKKLGWFQSIIEAGNSAKAMFRALAVWPSREGWEYGNTFFQGLLRTIPNFGTQAGMLFPSETPGHKTIRLTEPKAYRKGIGYGFTIIAEAYINFGPLGPFCFLGFLGFITRRLFDRAFYTRNLYRMILSISWTLCICNWVRNDSYSSIKPITWAFLIMFAARFVIMSTVARGRLAQPASQAAPPLASRRPELAPST